GDAPRAQNGASETLEGLRAQAGEGVERRRLATVRRDQPRLPAVERAAVLQQEPGEEIDARIRPRDLVRLPEIGGLLRPADADEGVGWIGLVAVLGDPDRLLAVEGCDRRDELVDVAELDRPAADVPRRRRVGRAAVVRMVGPGVER